MKVHLIANLCMVLLAGNVAAAPQTPATLQGPANGTGVTNQSFDARSSPEIQLLRDDIKALQLRLTSAEGSIEHMKMRTVNLRLASAQSLGLNSSLAPANRMGIVSAPATPNAPAFPNTPAVVNAPAAKGFGPTSDQQGPELQNLRNAVEDLKLRIGTAEKNIGMLQNALAQTNFSCKTVSISVNGAGVEQNCYPYRCRPIDGRCTNPPVCASVNDCAPPTVCDTSGHCIIFNPNN